MVGRSSSETARAMRNCCVCKAKKFFAVPKDIAMDGKMSNNTVRQMPLTNFALFAMFAMLEKVSTSGLASNVVCNKCIAIAISQCKQNPKVHVNAQQLHCRAMSCPHQKEQQPDSSQ